jgi:hypothetical protein
MSLGGAEPAGSSRILRLDPFSLPVSFEAGDARADEHTRFVELARDRVVVRRAVAGIRMAAASPVASYLGVAIRLLPPDATSDGGVAVVLEHSDPGLSVPVFVAPDGVDALAEWQSWSSVLGLPLLVRDADGSLREPFARMGGVRLAKAQPRRRRHTALRKRRPRLPLRRQPVGLGAFPLVHRGEREIIARS